MDDNSWLAVGAIMLMLVTAAGLAYLAVWFERERDEDGKDTDEQD